MTEEIIKVIKSIPKGKVASYGQIASIAGYPNGARQVVRILHTFSDTHDLPWHRVVNSKGFISLPAEGGELQKTMLISEGIVFDAEGRIDFNRFGWCIP